MDIAGSDLNNAAALAASLGIQSIRMFFFLLEENSCTLLNLQEVKGKAMYKMMLKGLNKNKLNERVHTPRRGHLEVMSNLPGVVCINPH